MFDFAAGGVACSMQHAALSTLAAPRMPDFTAAVMRCSSLNSEACDSMSLTWSHGCLNFALLLVLMGGGTCRGLESALVLAWCVEFPQDFVGAASGEGCEMCACACLCAALLVWTCVRRRKRRQRLNEVSS